MDKSVTVKFWTVQSESADECDFWQALHTANAKTGDERVCDIDGSFYQFGEDAQIVGDLFLGEVIRLQGEGLPSRIQKGKPASELKLQSNEFLGHHTGFVYDKATKAIGIEVRPSAAGLAKTRITLQRVASESSFVALPLLKKHTFDMMTEKKLGTFSFKVSDPVSLQSFDPGLTSFRENLLALKDMVNGAYLNVSIGVGSRREGLSRSSLMKYAGWLLGEKAANRGKVKKIRISQPGEEEAFLDFIKAQVTWQNDLNLSGLLAKDWKTRKEALTQAMGKAKPHVKRT